MKKSKKHGQKQPRDGRNQKKSHPGPQKPKLPRANLYGFHAVEAALRNSERQVDALYVTENGLKTIEENSLIQPSPTILPKDALEKLLPQGAVHQGVALVTKDLPETSVDDFIISAGQRGASKLVMLDQVTDPHNVGAILRSACAFGFDGMIMQRKHAPELNGVLAKTACGAVEHVPVAYETNLNRSLEALKEAGYFIYGLDERGEDIGTLGNIPDKAVIVLGAEGPGLRRLVKENCDTLIKLPMAGTMPSINVSNAAAVAFYAFS